MVVRTAGGGLLTAADFGACRIRTQYHARRDRGQREVYDLHMLIFWICVWIGVLVFGAMFYSMLRHRKSQGAVAAHFHESTAVEIVWTIVPFVILIAMAIPATQTLLKMEDVSKSDITIKVTGFQWKWRYDYMDQNIGFFSVLSTPRDQIENKAVKGEHYLLEVDRPLVVPVGKKVRFLITAMTSFTPGGCRHWRSRRTPYRVSSMRSGPASTSPVSTAVSGAELCGKDHGFMPIVWKRRAKADYASWLTEQKAIALASAEDPNKVWTKDELMAKGETVYGTNCVGLPSGQR